MLWMSDDGGQGGRHVGREPCRDSQDAVTGSPQAQAVVQAWGRVD